MTTSLTDLAREGRRAALATLNARNGKSRNVVSIFDGLGQRRQSVPQFHSIRASDMGAAEGPKPLLLAKPFAA
jgi:hypothetical protein